MIEVVWTLVPVLILVAIAVPSIRLLAAQYQAAQGRPHGQGDRQPMVLDLHLSRQWRLRDRLEHAVRTPSTPRKRGEPRLLAVDERMVVPAGAVVKLIVTSSRRHPQLRRARLLGEDGRRPGPPQRDLVQGRQARRLLRPVLRTVRRPPRLHADRGRGRARRRNSRAWVASKGGTMPGAGQPAPPDSTAASPVTNPPGSGGDDRAAGDRRHADPDQRLCWHRHACRHQPEPGHYQPRKLT